MRILRAAVLAILAAAPARATNFTLAITTSGPVSLSSVVTSTPSGIVCPPTCSASFVAGSTITLGEVSPSTVAFVGWGQAAHCRNNLPTCSFPNLVANSTVTATFDPILDLSFSGNGIGLVTSTAAGTTGVSCSSTGTCANGASLSMFFPMGTSVVLTQSTGTASAFVGWTSSVGGCGTASTCTVTLNGYTTVVATFTATGTVGVSSFTIAVSLPNGGGTVTSSPAGIACPGACSAAFASGTSVHFTTAAASGYRFAGWANGGCSGATPCVITSTSPLQGTGSNFTPAAYFYRRSP